VLKDTREKVAKLDHFISVILTSKNALTKRFHTLGKQLQQDFEAH
jgi:hypothetical protein